MKRSLINILIQRYPEEDEKVLTSAIMQGNIIVNNQKISKPGYKVDEKIEVTWNKKNKYVSRGAYKLLHALENFDFPVLNKIGLDAGCSTGGFTQVLIENGCRKVYAIDVGTNVLDYKLRINPRVVVFEKTNVRFIKKQDFCPVPDFSVVDVSFTSLQGIIENLFKIINGSKIIALIKPQFEVKLPKHEFSGVINDDSIIKNCLLNLNDYFKNFRIYINQLTASPIKGREGNKEFLALFSTVNKNWNLKQNMNKIFKNDCL